MGSGQEGVEGLGPDVLGPHRYGQRRLSVRPTPAEQKVESLADVLARLFVSRGWGRKTERLQLEQAWHEAADPAWRGDTRLLGLRRGVLEVEVRNAVLLQELAQFHRRPLLRRLRQLLPQRTIGDIRFRAGAW